MPKRMETAKETTPNIREAMTPFKGFSFIMETPLGLYFIYYYIISTQILLFLKPVAEKKCEKNHNEKECLSFFFKKYAIMNKIKII